MSVFGNQLFRSATDDSQLIALIFTMCLSHPAINVVDVESSTKQISNGCQRDCNINPVRRTTRSNVYGHRHNPILPVRRRPKFNETKLRSPTPHGMHAAISATGAMGKSLSVQRRSAVSNEYGEVIKWWSGAFCKPDRPTFKLDFTECLNVVTDLFQSRRM